MSFEVLILGSNSAIPAHDRHPSAQVLSLNHQNYLIDCGEGTQFQMIKYHVKRARLDHIFISHFHGDHYFGFMGLISSFNLTGRVEPLYVFAPKGLQEIIDVHFKYSNTVLKFPLHIQEIDTEKHALIFENRELEVYSIPLKHKIPTSGFLFKEKPRDRKLIAESIEKYQIPHTEISAIKKGADYKTPQGEIIPNEVLTENPKPPRSYAYCSDTVYKEDIIPILQQVDLLYHEATFDKRATLRAEETFHSTTEQAALIAKKADVKKLIIGHFSTRYAELEPLLEEAKEVFEHSFLALEGYSFNI